MTDVAEFTSCVGCGDSHAEWLLPVCLHPLCQRCELKQPKPRACPRCSAVSPAGAPWENFLLPLAGPRPQRYCESVGCLHSEKVPATFYCRGCRQWICQRLRNGHPYMAGLESHRDFLPVTNRPHLSETAWPTCRIHGGRLPLRLLCKLCNRLLCEVCSGPALHEASHASLIVPLAGEEAMRHMTERLENMARDLDARAADLGVACEQARAAASALEDNAKGAAEAWLRLKRFLLEDGLKEAEAFKDKLNKVFSDRQLQLSQSAERLSDVGDHSGRLADLMSGVLEERRRRPELSEEAAGIAMRYCLRPPMYEAAALGPGEDLQPPVELSLRFDFEAAKAVLTNLVTVVYYDVSLADAAATAATGSCGAPQPPKSSSAADSCALCDAPGDIFQCSGCGLRLHPGCHPSPLPPVSADVGNPRRLCAICDRAASDEAVARRLLLAVLLARPHPRLTAVAAEAVATRRPVGSARLAADLRAASDGLPNAELYLAQIDELLVRLAIPDA